MFSFSSTTIYDDILNESEIRKISEIDLLLARALLEDRRARIGKVWEILGGALRDIEEGGKDGGEIWQIDQRIIAIKDELDRRKTRKLE